MAKTMLGKALKMIMDLPDDSLGVLCDLLEKVNGEKGGVWMRELKKFLRKEPCWTEGSVTQVAQSKLTSSILELVSTVVVGATTGKFVAKEKFVINTKRNVKVLISCFDDNFKDWFLSGDGKTEDPISEQTLRYHTLRKSSEDGPIIDGFGGEDKALTTLSEMFSLVERQGKGEDGVLLNNGYANIFYIRDSAGVLRSVRVRWSGDSWDFRAFSVESPYRWYDGDRVFSRAWWLGSNS